jgi:BirA family biotin operon repressor/biotin-[acetyl-CoA-carboxylase] ligase
VPIFEQFDLGCVRRNLSNLDIHYEPQTSSTNDLAWQYVSVGGISRPFVALTDHQTAGRGQYGRQWWSGVGGLTFSIALQPASDSQPANLLPLATALAIIDGVSELDRCPSATVKWPNDVLIGKKKVAGVLIETRSIRRQRWCVIGIGINCNNPITAAPREIQASATSLMDECLTPIDRVQLLIEICRAFTRHWSSAEREPRKILQRILERSFYPLGSEIRVAISDSELVGKFAGFGPIGQLLIRNGDLTHEIASGRVISPTI